MTRISLKDKKVLLIWGVLFAFYLVFSLLFITPDRKKLKAQYHSSELKTVITHDGNSETTGFLNSDGVITIAADLGYATKVTTKTENSVLERFYDDKGNPIHRYAGYYALLRINDERGNNIRITYLDINDEPMIITSGYATEERKYNDKGQVISVWYYDAIGNPVRTPSYGYGKINEYDKNGKVHRITFVDAVGEPMMTGQGYSTVSRNYYVTKGPENGKVESEFYFDGIGRPVSLALGQYGVHKEYDENGRESVLTYLDAEGNLIATTKGYTTIKRTFRANNSIATERYFDIEGNPFSLSEGQYGIKIEDGQKVYLSADGSEMFNLKTLLYNQSYLVIIFALIIVLLSAFLDKKLNFALLVLYTIAIAYITLMFRESGEGKMNLEFFWSYKSLFTNSENRADILKNIWLFIPFGAILYRLYPRKTALLIPVVLSMLIEAIQYFARLGICEFDDVISNGIGGGIGFITSMLLCNLVHTQYAQRYSVTRKQTKKSTDA